MSKITAIIQPQAFEIVRDRTAEIIADELENQSALTYDPEIDADVFVERSSQIDKTELSVINISLSNGTYDNKSTNAYVTGTYRFDIDIYTHAKTTEEQSGDLRAALRLQRLMGLVRAILENPIYRTLGYTPGFVTRVFISEMNIAVPGTGKLDTLNTMMGRISFVVQATENTQLLTPRLADGFDTQVKMTNTNRGYAYTVN